MNSENGFRIIIVIDKFINPSHGSGVASWAVDLRDEFKKQGIWCEVAGYYEGSSQFDINAKTQEVRNQKLINIVDSNKINCVISATSWTAFNVWRKLEDHILKIATIHGAKESIVKRELLAKNQVDAFICVSEPVKKIAQRFCTNKPLFCINNGIDLTVNNSNGAKKKQIIWIGRLQIEQKRAHWLKYAAQILEKYQYTLHFVCR